MTEPQGFTPLTTEELRQKSTAAQEQDKGRQSVIELEGVGFGVYEEPRGNTARLVYVASSFVVPRLNRSIQGMVLVNDESGQGQKVGLISADPSADSANAIMAYNDGRIELVMEDASGRETVIDITAVMAENDVTAANIQRTALDMASDGEITRPTASNPNLRNEQQEIIDLINNAKQWAGVSR